MKEWKTRRADNGKVFVHLRKNQAVPYQSLLAAWGIRFDIEPDQKNSRQSL